MKNHLHYSLQGLPKKTQSPLHPYAGILESTYTFENPEISIWTRKFQDHVEALGIFSEFADSCPVSAGRADTVGILWHGFSEFMPWLLCQAAAKLSTNEKRHYVIQGAFEELGMRDVREIHSDMFRKSAIKAGLTPSRAAEIMTDPEATAPLDRLRGYLLSSQTDDEVLGILLGLEIPARENIETLFQSLAHTPALVEVLAQDLFFSLHRQIEVEHIRLAVSNYLRFCKTQEQRDRFMMGFKNGLGFWRVFWRNAARITGLRAGA